MVRLRQVLCACCSASLLLTMSLLAARFHEQRAVPLYAVGIAVDRAGRTVEVSSAADVYADARAIRGAADARADQHRWLASGSVPQVAGVDPSLFSGALLDLHLLGRDHGVTVAGWSPPWRYVWPRDSAVVISAYARTGHVAEAEALLTFLQSAQSVDGRFQARYLPDRPGVAPDARGVQFDGTGWALWSLAELIKSTPMDQRSELGEKYRLLLDRSTDALLRGVDAGTGLPFPSPDYWETSSQVTLATAAITLAGMRSAQFLHPAFALDPPDGLDAAASDLERAIVREFEPHRFARTTKGTARGVDLGVTFLLPPLGALDHGSVRAAWSTAPRFMIRPAGGLAPGGSWRHDGISWTPTVASYAMAAACIDPSAARHWLGWLSEHRTAAGSLPEKVLADGSPASVAPLAWTAAAVIVVGDQLQHGCR